MRNTLILGAVLGAMILPTQALAGTAPLHVKPQAIHSYTITVTCSGHHPFAGTVSIPANAVGKITNWTITHYPESEKLISSTMETIHNGAVKTGVEIGTYWRKQHPNNVYLTIHSSRLITMRKIGHLAFPEVNKWSINDNLHLLPGQAVKLPLTENGQKVVVELQRNA